MNEKTPEEIMIFKINMYLLEAIYLCCAEKQEVFSNKKKRLIDKKPFFEIIATQPTTFSKYKSANKNGNEKNTVTNRMLKLTESCTPLEDVFKGKKLITIDEVDIEWAKNLWHEYYEDEEIKKSDIAKECKEKCDSYIKKINSGAFHEKGEAYQIVVWMQEEVKKYSGSKKVKNDRIIEKVTTSLKEIDASKLNTCNKQILEDFYKELERVAGDTKTIKKYRDLMKQ